MADPVTVTMDGKGLDLIIQRGLLAEDAEKILLFVKEALVTGFRGVLQGDAGFVRAANSLTPEKVSTLVGNVERAVSLRDSNARRNAARLCFIEYVRLVSPGIIPMKSKWFGFVKEPACTLEYKRHVNKGEFGFLLACSGERVPFFRWDINGLSAK